MSISEPNIRPAARAAFLALGVVLGLAVHATAQKSKPLKEPEIHDLLRGGVTSTRIAALVDEMGIDFELTAESEQRFRDADAEQVLIDALRRASKRRLEETQGRTASLDLETKPGEAEVYLDDEPKGMSSSEGRLRLTGLQPRTYRLRVSLVGYRSWENQITVSAGETQRVYVTLAEKPPEKPPVTIPQLRSPEPSLLPIPGARVDSVKFYETVHDLIPKDERRYQNRFPRSSTRYVAFEVNFAFPKLESRTDFMIDAVWIGSDGKEVWKSQLNGYVLPGWTHSWHSVGWGCSSPPCRDWKYGTYTVLLYFSGRQFATGSFEIY